MKWSHKIKITFLAALSVGIITPTLNSCASHHKKTHPNFNDFKKAAEAESLINIVINANPQATGWSGVTASDLINPNWTTTSNLVSVSIISTLNAAIATFSAKYTNLKAYQVSDWGCSKQPKLLPSWRDFWTNALGEVAWKIVKNAHPTKTAWINDDNSKFSFKSDRKINNHTITVAIGDAGRTPGAVFQITYTLYKAYQVSDWKLIA